MNQPDPAEIERFAHLKSLPDGSLTRVEVGILVDEIDTLLAALATAEERADEAERSERTNRWYVGDEPMLRAIVDAQSEYIEVLEEAHADAAGFMFAHGQHDAPELIERGEQARERIAAALATYSKATGPQAENEGAT